MPRYCVISGNRADQAALIPVAKVLDAQWAHVDTLPSRSRFDSAISCSQAMAMAAEQLEKLKPDLVILGGDRFEILGAACAAHLMQLPIAHLSGGDITEGSQDDATRHAITKLAAIHFPTNQASADNLVALGEEKWRIHMVGAPQIDFLLSQELYDRKETMTHFGYKFPTLCPAFNDGYILVAYQPPTALEDPTSEIDELLERLRRDGVTCIFTTANTDAGGIGIMRKIIKFCEGGHHCMVKMDQKLFLSAMKHCKVMIGNSSAGFYEAPSLGVEFINFGVRQKGRFPLIGDGKAAQRIKSSLEAMMTVPRNILLQKRVQCNSTSIGNGSIKNVIGGITPKKSLYDGIIGNPNCPLEGGWSLT